jgi:hypothetical protein
MMSESEFYEKRNQLELSVFWQAKLANYSPVAVAYLESLWAKRPAQLEGLAALAKQKAELFQLRRTERMKIFQISFTKDKDGERAILSKRIQGIQGNIEKVKIAERDGRKAGVVKTVQAQEGKENWTLAECKVERMSLHNRISKKRAHLRLLETSEAGLVRVATAKETLKELEKQLQDINILIAKCLKS